MLNANKSRYERVIQRPVSNATLITAEGQALVADPTVDGGGVSASAGSGSEVFVGISYSQQRSLNAISYVEEVIVASDGKFSLGNVSTGAAFRKFWLKSVDGLSQSALALTAAAPGSPTIGETEHASGQQNFTTNVGLAGRTIVAQYRFAPSAVQAQMIQGDVLPGGDSGLILNSVGVITVGDVYTTEFDPAADWPAGGVLRTNAAGLFTLGGSGPICTGARMISKPNAASPFLGISLSNG